MGLDQLVLYGVQRHGVIGIAVADIVVVIRNRHRAKGEPFLFFHGSVMHGEELLQKAPERPLIGKRRLHGILQIRKTGLARPCVSVIKIRAVIQSPPFKNGQVIFLADNGGSHRPDLRKIGMVERGREGQAVDILRILLHLRLRDGKLGQMGMVKQLPIHKHSKQTHRRPSRYRKVVVPSPVMLSEFCPSCSSSSGNVHVPTLTDFLNTSSPILQLNAVSAVVMTVGTTGI